MNEVDQAIALRVRRLEAIGQSLRDSGRALALLALGSAADTARLDRWSDLDFFAIVRPGEKHGFIHDLGWLSSVAPLAWAFRNTVDGWKALSADGVFLEFAVFELPELERIPFAPGRIVWQADGFDAALCSPRIRGGHGGEDPDWLLGEVLSNLYIGLGRWRRGERLAGMRAIQVHALDNLLKLAARRPGIAAAAVAADPFAPDRRVEARLPDLAPRLSMFAGGIDHCPQAATAMLDWLIESGFAVPDAMRDAIRGLAA